jgi:hypothetical protein
MKKHLVMLVLMIFLSVTLFSGCNEITKTLSPPNFIITSKTSREGYEGPDRVGYVDVTVKNTGGSGEVTVYVRVNQGSNEWTKSKTVNLGNDKSISLSFRFDEIQFWTLDSWSFSAWCE